MKGYPKSRFEILNQTQVQNIDTRSVDKNIALYMQPYTSDKGTEDWELLTSLEDFTSTKGSMSFKKHGQAQLTVAQALRTGAYVLGKRLVSDDATLANTTVLAHLVKSTVDSKDITFVYLYTKSGKDCKTFEEACEVGYGEFDAEAESIVDIPLLTVTPMGRGESLMYFRLTPEYAPYRSKNSTEYAKYSFEVIENNEVLESISVSMNPEIIFDGVSQSVNTKVKSLSKHVRVKMYEDGIYALVKELAKTTGEDVPAMELINCDFINGYDRKGINLIDGVVTAATNESSVSSLWTANKPSDITVYDLANGAENSDGVGIPLSNGSFGTLGNNPMGSEASKAELKKLLLDVFGANNDVTDEGDIQYPSSFNSIIYDLDAYKVDCIFDCAWPVEVKQAIVNLINFRGDMVFLSDLGTENVTSLAGISEAVEKSNVDSTSYETYYSSYESKYHNYFKIIDPFSKKEITVTMPYLLIDKMTTHIAKGINHPFAGMANNLVFDNIIENSINFLPVEIPGIDQKQELVNMNVNYLSLYDGVPVMETMYVNQNEHSQLSYLHNIMAIQEIIKVIRTRCPRTRYTFLDGNDLEKYISDVQSIVKEYSSNFKSISCEYMADDKYEQNNIFYAVLKVQFKNFIQEEYFKIIAIS